MMSKSRNKALITALVIIVVGALVAWGIVSSPAEITLEPDHLEMLITLDGEFDEYYEELTLKCNGKKVKGEKVEWHSDDPEIAEVDESGWVTSMGVGSTVITARYKGTTVQCPVEVTQRITSDTLGE